MTTNSFAVYYFYIVTHCTAMSSVKEYTSITSCNFTSIQNFPLPPLFPACKHKEIGTSLFTPFCIPNSSDPISLTHCLNCFNGSFLFILKILEILVLMINIINMQVKMHSLFN